MKFTTPTSPYLKQDNSVSAIMQQVILALLPGTLVMLWYFGWGTLSNLLLGIGFALILEALVLMIRKKPISLFLSDYSVVVTAWLLALAMPAFSPWWLLLIAMIFAVVIAKHLYGGLGQNPFNPAMVGYAAALISYPLEMTRWVTPQGFSFTHIGLTDSLIAVFGNLPQLRWDAITMATPLDTVKVNLDLGQTLNGIYQLELFSTLSGQGWDMINFAFLAGGIWLLYRRIISWHIPVALLVTLSGISGFFWLLNSSLYPSPLFHCFSGATMLAA
ncbi:MAG: RnfABCDGE type electron transport complex subunit D, partial [Thiolinea sp.]